MLSATAGYLSGIAIIMSFVPYIRDIFKGKTKPERISWLIWAILGSISFFTQLAKGASYSLIFVGVQTVGDILVFLLALKFGFGGFLKRDKLALVGAGVSLVLWYITKEAAVALFIVIFIDAIGAYLTAAKAYEEPTIETISSWALVIAGGIFSCIAVGKIDFVLLAYPLYVVLASGSIFVAIKLGFRREAKVLA